MLGNVECEFRPVDPKWIKQLMGWAYWFYEGKEFLYSRRSILTLRIASLKTPSLIVLFSNP